MPPPGGGVGRRGEASGQGAGSSSSRIPTLSNGEHARPASSAATSLPARRSPPRTPPPLSAPPSAAASTTPVCTPQPPRPPQHGSQAGVGLTPYSIPRHPAASRADAATSPITAPASTEPPTPRTVDRMEAAAATSVAVAARESTEVRPSEQVCRN
jgi:hypothetical protein